MRRARIGDDGGAGDRRIDPRRVAVETKGGDGEDRQVGEGRRTEPVSVTVTWNGRPQTLSAVVQLRLAQPLRAAQPQLERVAEHPRMREHARQDQGQERRAAETDQQGAPRRRRRQGHVQGGDEVGEGVCGAGMATPSAPARYACSPPP